MGNMTLVPHAKPSKSLQLHLGAGTLANVVVVVLLL